MNKNVFLRHYVRLSVFFFTVFFPPPSISSSSSTQLSRFEIVFVRNFPSLFLLVVAFFLFNPSTLLCVLLLVSSMTHFMCDFSFKIVWLALVATFWWLAIVTNCIDIKWFEKSRNDTIKSFSLWLVSWANNQHVISERTLGTKLFRELDITVRVDAFLCWNDDYVLVDLLCNEAEIGLMPANEWDEFHRWL